MTLFEYDGMNRVTLKKAGSTSTNAVFKQVYDDDNRKMTATDFKGFRTETIYDKFFRPIDVRSYRPNRNTNIDYDTPVATPVKTGWSKSTYDIMSGKVSMSTKYSDNDGEDNHRIISKTEYDKLGRPVRLLYKNTDDDYSGNKVFQLLSETEYLDEENASISRSWLGDADNSYRQTKIVNDWLERGILEEYSWPGKNGTGEALIVKNSYNHVGNLTQKEMPNGEKYRYIYNSAGKLEKILYPDGSYSIVNYDNNGNVLKTKDRRGIIITNTYNKSDLLVKSETGDIEIVTLHTHLGPASACETEDSTETIKNEFEYHWSAGVEKNTQTIDGSLIQIVENTFDNGGNQITVKATGSGTGGNAWDKTLNIDNQYHSATPDNDHFNKTAILEGATTKMIKETDYLGLINKLKYGTTTAREIAYTYENFLKAKSLISNEATPELNITLTRDFTGNILTKEGNTYTYDGMSRLLSGESEDYSYDEISNLLARGNNTYEYQSIGADKNQMRLKSFNDGTNTYEYTYDDNGNTKTITGRFSDLDYDNLNRLRQITHTGGQIDKYSYNSAGLRFKKEEDVSGSNIVIYSMYSGNNPVIQEKYDGATLIETRFNIISGGQVLGHIRKIYGTSENFEYFYLDNLGSRRVVLDNSGSVLDKFTYSAYGEVTHVSGSNGYLASFTGKEYDATDLIYFNARYYDPVVGRFLTEDSIRDGLNYYNYCGNTPVNRVDPDGHRYDEGIPDEADKDKRDEERKRKEAADKAMADRWEAMGESYRQRNPKGSRPTESRRITNIFSSIKHSSGIDIGGLIPGVAGDNITAISGGVVTTAGIPEWSDSKTPYVIIEDKDGIEYRYGHVDNIQVKVGDKIDPNQFIAEMSDKGAPGQVHLHLEIIINDKKQNPQYFFD